MKNDGKPLARPFKAIARVQFHWGHLEKLQVEGSVISYCRSPHDRRAAVGLPRSVRSVSLPGARARSSVLLRLTLPAN